MLKVFLYVLCLGYITTTKLKIVAVFEDDVLSDLPIEQQEKDALIKAFMVRRSLPISLFGVPYVISNRSAPLLFQANVHTVYVDYLLNPFNKVGETKIESESFDKAICNAAKNFNQEV